MTFASSLGCHCIPRLFPKTTLADCGTEGILSWSNIFSVWSCFRYIHVPWEAFMDVVLIFYIVGDAMRAPRLQESTFKRPLYLVTSLIPTRIVKHGSCCVEIPLVSGFPSSATSDHWNLLCSNQNLLSKLQCCFKIPIVKPHTLMTSWSFQNTYTREQGSVWLHVACFLSSGLWPFPDLKAS